MNKWIGYNTYLTMKIRYWLAKYLTSVKHKNKLCKYYQQVTSSVYKRKRITRNDNRLNIT